MVALIAFVVTLARLGLACALMGLQDNVVPSVAEVTVVDDGPLEIRPCESVTVLINIKLIRAADLREWNRILRAASAIVRVNGTEFRNRLGTSSTSNDAATFALSMEDDSAQGSAPGAKSDRGRFVITFFLNALDRACLFQNPGTYSIELVIGDHILPIKIKVLAPTPTERIIMEVIDDLPVLLFLTDPTDRDHATPQVLNAVAKLVQDDTPYKKKLSIALGLAKLNTPRGLDRAVDPARDQELRRQRLQEVHGLLCPFVLDTIRSELEAAAAFQCGVVSSILGTLDSDKAAAAKFNSDRDRAWQAVAESPFALKYAAQAKKYLAEVKNASNGQ
jgi:hypothetical protein